VRGAGRKAEHRRVRRGADRPADDVSGDDLLRDRLAGDLLLQEPLELESALAMSGENDRALARTADERIEGGRHVVVSNVQSLLRVITLEQERAERRLAVAWGPDLPGGIEGARLALNEQARAELGVAPGLQRRVPPVAFEIGRGMDIKDRRAAARAAG